MSQPNKPDWPARIVGRTLSDLTLPSTRVEAAALASLGKSRSVLYVYPMTGRPGVPNPDGWDRIPGARGCTPQACSFRDHFEELRRLGVDHLYGLSTQSTAYQREAWERLELPFLLLSDEDVRLVAAMRLPTFETAGMTLLKRFTLVIDAGRVTHVFYPVFPPDQSAQQVIDWLAERVSS